MKHNEFDVDDSFEVHAGISAKNVNQSAYSRFGKRLCDVALSLLILPIVAPVVAICWLLTRRDGGSGFYFQNRVGRDGQMFKCWKVRSMRVDAESVLTKLLAQDPDMAEEWRLNHKLENDPRITRLGNFLRKTSLDELPQLWNVLRGDMSLVGPRPVTTEELDRYGPNAQTYMQVSPGVTGLWQVNGRSRTTYAQRVRMDVKYVRRLSFMSDINILGLTVREVLVGRGQ